MAGIQKIVMTKKVIFIFKNSETKNINAIQTNEKQHPDAKKCLKNVIKRSLSFFMLAKNTK